MKRVIWLPLGLVLLIVVLVLLFVSRSQYGELEADYDALQTDLTSVQASYDSLKQELNNIKKVYPPRDFSSLAELQEWLLENDVSELPPVDIFEIEQIYSRALQIQADALKDGYIISVDIDVLSYDIAYIACVAIIDGDFWWWYPETDELNQYFDLGKVTRD